MGMGGIDSRGEVVGGLNRIYRSDCIETLKVSTILEGTKLAAEKGGHQWRLNQTQEWLLSRSREVPRIGV